MTGIELALAEINARVRHGKIMVCEGQGDQSDGDGCGGQGGNSEGVCSCCLGVGLMTPQLQETIAEARRLRERLEDKTNALRVEIAAKQGAHNEIRIMEMAIRHAVRALDEEQAIQPESQIHHDLKDALP